MSKPTVLTLDIETAPIRSYHWGLFDQNIGLEQIETEWSILSYSAKWLDDKAVTFSCTGGRGVKKVRDDKKLCEELWKLLDKADIVVTQNGVSFDLKKINTRMAIHGIGPYSPVRMIDTLRAARKHFGNTSNKLAWMSKHFTPETVKSKHKKFPGFELWLECLADNMEAWTEMAKYNKQDVLATEALYLKIRPWITNHPNLSAYSLSESPTCPKCDSHKLQARGYTVSQVGKYQRYQCTDCGGWSRGKQLLTPATVRKQKLL